MKQAIAHLWGLWLGRGLPKLERCYSCSAPCRTEGGYKSPLRYIRVYCTNKLCRNWIPF